MSRDFLCNRKSELPQPDNPLRDRLPHSLHAGWAASQHSPACIASLASESCPSASPCPTRLRTSVHPITQSQRHPKSKQTEQKPECSTLNIWLEILGAKRTTYSLNPVLPSPPNSRFSSTFLTNLHRVGVPMV